MFGIRDAQIMARSTHMVTNPEIDVAGDEDARGSEDALPLI